MTRPQKQSLEEVHQLLKEVDLSLASSRDLILRPRLDVGSESRSSSKLRCTTGGRGAEVSQVSRSRREISMVFDRFRAFSRVFGRPGRSFGSSSSWR